MEYEIDFLAVGQGERSGDAIAVRFGPELPFRQTVMIIDGGTRENGAELVKHLRTHYGTLRADFVLSTHPDMDHTSGLNVVLEELEVGTLLMHKPWDHAREVCGLLESPMTPTGARRRLSEELCAARALAAIAERRNIPIVEPFAGLKTDDGTLTILGPTESEYQRLLTLMLEESRNPVAAAVERGVFSVRRFLRETLALGSLTDPRPEDTSPMNNTSVLTLLTLGSERLLFTGDAGVGALTSAADLALERGIDLSSLSFLQVPHHGSRRNVGPTILRRIKAPVAYISAAKEAPKHPSKLVTNELHRVNCCPYVTAGRGIRHSSPAAPPRAGWVSVAPYQFQEEVEEED